MNSDKAADAAPAARFWRLPKVREYLGISRSTLLRAVDAGEFPRPVKLTANCVAWPAAEVEAWAAKRIAARNGEKVAA